MGVKIKGLEYTITGKLASTIRAKAEAQGMKPEELAIFILETAVNPYRIPFGHGVEPPLTDKMSPLERRLRNILANHEMRLQKLEKKRCSAAE